MNLPFSIDRNCLTSLTDQVTDGFRRAIADGTYASGETLPSLRELSANLGVSLIVTRAAYARLEKEGLVALRRGFGCTVVGGKARLWKGCVLLVTRGRGYGFVSGIVTDVIRERLLKAHYRVTSVTAYEGADGCAQLDYAFKQTFDLVVTVGCEKAFMSRISRAKVPTVVFGGRLENVPRGMEYIPFQSESAVPDFVRHCKRAGVKSVLQVGLGMHMSFANAERELNDAGIRVRLWRIRPDDTVYGGIEAAQKRAAQLFERQLSRGRAWLPDVIYFSDDYVAQAALVLMLAQGVRVPEDVRVVTWANKGHVPVFPKTLTRMEYDPVEAGATVAERILARLESRATCVPMSVPHYVIGESFPVVRKEAEERRRKESV